MLSEKNVNASIIDCVTRWSSTFFNMLTDFISKKDLIETFGVLNRKLIVTSSEFDLAKNLAKTLDPANKATKKFQHGQLMLPDMYFIWLECFHTVSSPKTEESELLKLKLDSRVDLLQNKCLKAVTYMDPRLKSIVSEEERRSNRTFLETFYNLINNVEKDNETDGYVEPNNSLSTTDDPFELFLQTQENLQQNNENEPITVEFNKFESVIRIRETDFRIFEYWYSIKKEYPKMLKIAKTLLATPATQVSVERLFSTLAFVVNSNRSNLSKELISDIMLVIIHREKIKNI
jgi:hypothetical protein